MCSPTGMRIVLTIAALRRWPLAKADVKAAFLRTGRADRDVSVRPPLESEQKQRYWLLLSADYGLGNSNAKFQVQADDLIITIRLCHLAYFPQLF